MSAMLVVYTFGLWALLAYTVYVSMSARTVKQSLTVWFIFGFFSNFIIFSTYYVALPLEGIDNFLGFLLLTSIISYIAFILGSLYLFLGWISWITRNNSLIRYISIVSAFTLIEIARPYALVFSMWGDGSVFGSGSSWSIANIMANTPLLVFAKYGGIVALGFVLIAITGLAIYPLPKKAKFLCLVVLSIFFYGAQQSNVITGAGKPIRVAALSTSFPHANPDEDIDAAYSRQVRILHPFVMRTSSSAPDIVVLPEDARYLDLQTRKERQELLRLFPETVFIDGTTRVTKEGRENLSLVFDTKTREVSVQGKHFLFPFGEYIPYVLQPLLAFFMGKEELASYKSVHEYSPVDSAHVVETRFGKIGILICSELASNDAITALAAADPDIVVVQSSLTWTHNRAYFVMNHTASLKVLAVTLGKSVISVANDGPSIVLRSNGEIVSFTGPGNFVRLFTVTGHSVTGLK